MARTLAPADRAVVKATSYTSEIAADLIGPASRAMFLTARPDAYIAGILAGENSVRELQALAAFRAQRLSARGIAPPAPRTLADLAAIAWACETTALEAAAECLAPNQVRWADFDAMLADLPAALVQTSEALDLDADANQLAAIAVGPLACRYSKDLSFDYSAGLRRELYDQAMAEHGRDIDAAIAGLRQLATASPHLERALARGLS